MQISNLKLKADWLDSRLWGRERGKTMLQGTMHLIFGVILLLNGRQSIIKRSEYIAGGTRPGFAKALTIIWYMGGVSQIFIGVVFLLPCR